MKCDYDHNNEEEIPVSQENPALLYVAIRDFYPEDREFMLYDVENPDVNLNFTTDFNVNPNAPEGMDRFDVVLTYNW